jgi:ribosome recycling factor
MTEEIEFILDSTKESMIGSIAHRKEFLNIRAGKASPAMLGSVFVDYYGSATHRFHMAKLSVPDARTITLQPFERNMLHAIEKQLW